MAKRIPVTAACPKCGGALSRCGDPFRGALLQRAHQHAHCEACGRFWARKELGGLWESVPPSVASTLEPLADAAPKPGAMTGVPAKGRRVNRKPETHS